MPFRVLDEPIRHLACVVEGVAARRERVRRHEARAPGLRAPGGGSVNAIYYLPEDRPVTPVAVPASDRPAIAEVVAPHPPRLCGRVDAPVVTLAQSDRYWALSPLTAEDRQADIAPVALAERFAPGDPGGPSSASATSVGRAGLGGSRSRPSSSGPAGGPCRPCSSSKRSRTGTSSRSSPAGGTR